MLDPNTYAVCSSLSSFNEQENLSNHLTNPLGFFLTKGVQFIQYVKKSEVLKLIVLVFISKKIENIV